MGLQAIEDSMKIIIKNQLAQSIIEYALLVGTVAVAFSLMFYFAKRVTDGKLKLIERQINLSISEE